MPHSSLLLLFSLAPIGMPEKWQIAQCPWQHRGYRTNAILAMVYRMIAFLQREHAYSFM